MNPVVIGNATLFLGDCRHIIPTLPKVDACITDPPYGQKFRPAEGERKVREQTFRGSKRIPTFTSDDVILGDDAPFDPSLILSFGLPTIAWGANWYASRLPDSGAWLCWDKRIKNYTNNFADCEMAWTNIKTPSRMFRHLWNGGLRASEHGETRVHPTQKPIALMRWCVGLIGTAETIVDPYLGSGTTGVACVQEGKKFVGIEIDPRYFDVACRRIDEAQRQSRLIA